MDYTNDYVLDVMEAVSSHHTDIFYDTFNNCFEELNILPDAYRNNKVVIEEVEVTSSGKGFFATIIEWLKRIINKFTEMAKSLFENNKEWFQDNSHRFDKISDNAYSDIKVTIIPYWKVGEYKPFEPAFKPEDPRLGKDKLKSEEEIMTAMYPKFKGLSVSGNVIEGAKIWYRGGSNNLVSLSGSDVKKHVRGMLEYCNNYVSKANTIKEQLEQHTTELEKAETELTKAQESTMFCFLEGSPICETAYADMIWENSRGEQFVMEAGNKKNKKDKEDKDKPGSNNGSVSNSNDKPAPENETPEQKKAREEKEKNDKEEANKKEKDDKISNKEAIKRYWQAKIKTDATMLTIAEERYHAYVRTLKGILQEAGHRTTDKEKAGESK